MAEGIGDHGCEYMTGGIAVILGSVGKNFGAGMSGGLAYIYDPDQTFKKNCNLEMVDLFAVDSKEDKVLYDLVKKHAKYTDSLKAQKLLQNWDEELKNFVKVYPKEYHKVNDALETCKKQGVPAEQLAQKAFDLLQSKGA